MSNNTQGGKESIFTKHKTGFKAFSFLSYHLLYKPCCIVYLVFSNKKTVFLGWILFISISNEDTLKFVVKCLLFQFKLSLQSMTTKGYLCRVWQRRDIPAKYGHDEISLQSMTTKGYPCKVWPRRDIPAEYDHDEISLQSMTTTG